MSIVAVISIIILNSSSVRAEETVCDRLRRLKAQQPIFSDPDENLLKVRKLKNLTAKESRDKKSSTSGVYYFLEGAAKIIVFNGHDYSLELSVPQYDWRPISARWINPKLIYVSVSFNPHYGAYWIYDVEEGKIIINELDNDGWDAWQQCTGQTTEQNIK